jgi:hypothetical protein
VTARTDLAVTRGAATGVGPALVGLAGALLVTLAAWPAGTLARPARVEHWLAADGFGWVPQLGGGVAIWLAGLGCLVAAWVWLRRQSLAGLVRPLVVAAVVAVWLVPLLIAPPVGSRDLYSYAAHGELRSLGFDPGATAPTSLPAGSPFVVGIAASWRHVVSAYGPLSTGLSWLAVRLGGHHVAATVIWLRMEAVAAVAALAVAVRSLARVSGTDADDAFVLLMACPLLVVHGVGGGHNEVLMAALMVAGLGVAERRRRGSTIVAVVLIGLATAVKLPAALAAVFVGWRAGPSARPVAARFARAVVALAGVAVVVEATGLATGVGWGWLSHGVRAGGTVSTSLSASLALGRLVAWLIGSHGQARTVWVRRVQDALQAAVGVVVGVLVGRSVRLGLRALALALVVASAFGMGVQPWYLLWSLPLLVVLHARERAIGLVGAVAIVSVWTNPGGGGLTPNPGGWPPLVLLALVGLAGWRVWRPARQPAEGV